MNNKIDFGNLSYPDMSILNEMLLTSNLNNMNNNINNTYNTNKFNNNSNGGNTNLAGSYEGYIRGNLFNNLYDQYKDYRPAKLIPNNEQAELLLNINQTTFAAHDMRLYLDLHPDDQNMIRLFNNMQEQAKNAMNEYERRFGPIQADSPSENNMFSWQVYSFPWEMEEM